MKRRNNRFLAGTLAGLMMLTMLPVTALAAEGEKGDANNTTTLTTTDGTPVPGASDNGIENIVNDTGDSQDTGANADANDTGDANPTTGNDDGGENGAPVGGSDVQSGGSGNEGEGGSETGAPAASGENGSETGGGSTTEGTESSTPDPAPKSYTAKIDGTEYETLDEAINAAQDGDTIEISNDEGVITVNEIRRNIVINGNGHTVTIPEQKTDNYSLNISGSLTFNNTNVECANNIDNVKAWSIALYSNGVLTLDKGSRCTMEKHGIYAHADSTINIKGGSKLIAKNATDDSTLMADEGFANLNIEEGSTVVVDRAYRGDEVPNGINNFKINVVNSTLNVTNCENQGLVRCWLTLDNSNAEISGNDTGITGYPDTDTLTLKTVLL